MPSLVIADASCFILLGKIGEIDLLKAVYGQVITTPTIADEVGEPLPTWVQVRAATDNHRQHLLEMQLDRGESSAIALGLELPDSILILDDYKARKIAERLGMRLTGTLGILIKAKNTGVLSTIRPLLDKIRQTNFRLSAELEAQVLQATHEQ